MIHPDHYKELHQSAIETPAWVKYNLTAVKTRYARQCQGWKTLLKYPGLKVFCQTLFFVEGDVPNLLVGLLGETGLSGCSLEYSSSAAQARKEV